MFSKKILVIISAFLITLALPIGTANAIETPQFPSCTNPQGDLKVSYNSGTHGVPGDSNTYTGSDSVYTLNSDQSLQCFCAQSGNGIQTNWLKVGELSESEQKTYEVDGYTYIPDGSAWGLESTGYAARNSSYSCGGTGGSVQGISATQGGTGGPSVQASILGLASTGDITSLFGFFLAGVATLLLGFTLKKKE